MNTGAIRSTLVRALGVALALASSSALASTYRLTDLGTLGNATFSQGVAVNALGQVTGFANSAGDVAQHAFLWDGTTMQDLGTLGGFISEGFGINNSGQVTGSSETTDFARHAFLWDGTTLQDLGTLGGTFSDGKAINGSGQVMGNSFTTGNALHAFLWDGTMQDLGTLGGSDSFGIAINDSGHVTGNSSTEGNAAVHAFLWDGSTMQDLGTLGGSDSSGAAINASAQVTGNSSTEGNAAVHAFLWDGSTMQDLGTLGGTFSDGIAINASGQVTGNSNTADDAATHAFLWDGTMLQDLGTPLEGSDSFGVAINALGQVTGFYMTDVGDSFAFQWDGTAMHDLNAVIDTADPLQPFVTLFDGVDMNDLGQILANGFDSRTGESHAYLVSPIPGSVPEPGTLALLGLGLVGLGLTRRRANLASHSMQQRARPRAGLRKAQATSAGDYPMRVTASAIIGLVSSFLFKRVRQSLSPLAIAWQGRSGRVLTWVQHWSPITAVARAV